MTRALLSVLLCAVLPAAAGVEPLKTLRVAFPVAENGFDPARNIDLYSQTVTAQIFESLYTYDYLAAPPVVRPLVAAAMPEASADFRIWTIRVRPGIFFAPDPVFKGRPRELVAADVIYNLKRRADPAVRSPTWTGVAQLRIVGLEALRDEALTGKKSFDYDRPIEGLRLIDRYTLQVRLQTPLPRFVHALTGPANGLLAREVVEAYGERTMEHPVGTGPFMLASWRRSSKIVLARNPAYREVFFDAQPASDDAEAVAIARQLRGRRLPMVDRVEIAIVAENQPRWLAFVNGDLDEIEVPGDLLRLALPNGKVAPYLRRRGVQAQTVARALVHYLYFNMSDPIVGGYTPDKVALRRAISLGMDVERNIRLLNGGQGVVAHSPIAANLTGFDPAFRSDNGVYNPALANALLDTYGYVDSGGDGWRDMPSGEPLVLRVATQTFQISRQQDEMFERYMTALRLKVEFKPALWQDNAKNGRAGKLMMWHLGDNALVPDGLASLVRLYGPSGGANMSRFDLPEFNMIYENLLAMPDGEERNALFDRAKRLVVAYQPEKTTVHGVVSYLNQPWLIGYRRNAFGPGWYHMVDIEFSAARAAQKK